VTVYHGAFDPLEWKINYERMSGICYFKVVCMKDAKESIVGVHYLGPNAGEVM